MALTLVFSPTDSSSGLADKVYSYGNLDGEDVSKRETIVVTQEIVGLYFIPNLVSPDYEGICFLMEDGSIERVGQD